MSCVRYRNCATGSAARAAGWAARIAKTSPLTRRSGAGRRAGCGYEQGRPCGRPWAASRIRVPRCSVGNRGAIHSTWCTDRDHCPARRSSHDLSRRLVSDCRIRSTDSASVPPVTRIHERCGSATLSHLAHARDRIIKQKTPDRSRGFRGVC